MRRRFSAVLCTTIIVVVVWPKQTTKATKRLQHQNRTKYETIVEEIRLQLTQVM
jgi:hypothetical protein